jgi:hypothetical protein
MAGGVQIKSNPGNVTLSSGFHNSFDQNLLSVFFGFLQVSTHGAPSAVPRIKGQTREKNLDHHRRHPHRSRRCPADHGVGYGPGRLALLRFRSARGGAPRLGGSDHGSLRNPPESDSLIQSGGIG